MTYDEQQVKRIANYLAGFAHILGGRPGHFAAFRTMVDLMLGGPLANLASLMHFADQVKVSGKPLLWIHQCEDAPQVPQIGVVMEVEGQMRFIENTMLWLGDHDDRAVLVPDGFNLGCYRFDDDYRLHHMADAPGTSFEDGKEGMVRACNRLATIQLEQWERGDVFELPQLAKAA